MDGSRFDSLARSLSTVGTRRGLLSVLVAIPVAGAFAALLQGESDAKGRRKRRKKRQKHQQGDGKQNRKGKQKGQDKGKDKCTKAGQTPQKGTPCCDGLVQDGGVCAVPASPPPPGCTPTTCAAQGKTCGSLPDGCGVTLSCGTCANPTPVCVNTTCGACTSSSQCPTGAICDGGTCQTCTVICGNQMPADCGAALQAAIAPGTAGGHTVYVCPGTYRGGFTLPATLTAGVTVIGAGEEANPVSNTVLDANGAGRVLQINAGVGTVVLERLHLTGGDLTGSFGAGVRHEGTTLQMRDCTVTGNTVRPGSGGGISHAVGTTLELTRCTVSANRAINVGISQSDGGGINSAGTTATLTDCLIADNSADNVGGGIRKHGNPVGFDMVLAGNTVVRGNSAFGGGGIYVSGGTMTIGADCRVTDNTAAGGNGGGIRNTSGTVTLSGPTPALIVVDNCVENCVGTVPGCDSLGGTCP